jgi:hypothetical protein
MLLRIVAVVKNSTNRFPARSPAFVMSVGSIANPDRATARDVTSAVPIWICLIYNIISFML